MLRHRLKMKKSRNALAKELGVSVKTIWGWEANRRLPSMQFKERVRYLLGV